MAAKKARPVRSNRGRGATMRNQFKLELHNDLDTSKNVCGRYLKIAKTRVSIAEKRSRHEAARSRHSPGSHGRFGRGDLVRHLLAAASRNRAGPGYATIRSAVCFR